MQAVPQHVFNDECLCGLHVANIGAEDLKGNSMNRPLWLGFGNELLHKMWHKDHYNMVMQLAKNKHKTKK